MQILVFLRGAVAFDRVQCGDFRCEQVAYPVVLVAIVLEVDLNRLLVSGVARYIALSMGRVVWAVAQDTAQAVLMRADTPLIEAVLRALALQYHVV